jgi:transposase-like protein
MSEHRAGEWQSRLLPRYERRARAVDAAVLSVYLAGANQRRIKGALAPLLRGTSLSKSASSRLVGRIKSLLGQWRPRSLAEDGLSICIWTPLRYVSGWCRRW